VRVIAGRFRGRRLAAPPVGVRPTTDRVRERLFAVLGEPPPDGSVVDLYCGAGTLGIEALSRGAERAFFVDRSAASLRVLARNLASLGDAELAVSIHRQDALRFVEKRWPQGAVAWVFLDPPYGDEGGLACLEALGRLHAESLSWVAFEGPASLSIAAIGSLVPARSLDCGDTRVTLLKGGLSS